jgi:hypothetical protein
MIIVQKSNGIEEQIIVEVFIYVQHQKGVMILFDQQPHIFERLAQIWSSHLPSTQPEEACLEVEYKDTIQSISLVLSYLPLFLSRGKRNRWH